MYESPIEMLISDIQHQLAQQQDEEVYRAVVSVGINVDKEELLRALKYDRDQYNKGHLDGYTDAMASIVRCKDCKGWCPVEIAKKYGAPRYCTLTCIPTDADDFCSYGERREGE